MKIEILFPEICNLYGESANVSYLKRNLPEAIFYETNLNDEIKFINEKIDLVYIGACSDSNLELIIEKLKKFKKQIKEKLDNNQVFLATGNSFEIFSSYILDENNKRINGLNIFNFYVKRNYEKRHNSLFLGTFNNISIVGYKSQFSQSYELKNNHFIDTKRGIGLNEEEINEGIHYNNFFATYLLGPMLILNPYFTKYLLSLIGYNKKLAYEEALIDAYNYRLKELEDPNTIIESKH